MFFSCVNITYANVIINEVKISPTEDRFVELYNNGSSSVDLTDWYIQRKTSSGADFGSLVSKTYFNGKSIGARGYFVISRGDITNTDMVFPSLTLTESNTIQLKNSSQNIVDKVGWGDVDDCGDVCVPNPTEGKSIQRTSGGSWTLSSSTAGSSNTSSSSSSDTSEDSSLEEDNSDSTVLSTSVKKEEIGILKITTKIISPKVVVAGIPFTLDSLTTTNEGKTYIAGKFIWNFGDGNNIQVNRAEPFDYTYDYEGEYVLSLYYFDNSFTEIPDAINKIVIKVIPSDIFISSVGSYIDPYIELENKSSYDMDISSWIINGVNRSFIIPKGTIISKSNKIKLSPRITGFNGEDIKYVNITNPDREVVATYPTEKKKVIRNILTSNNSSYKDISKVNNVLENNTDKIEDSNIINLNDLGASVSDSKVNISNSTFSIIGLFVVIGIGLVSFLLIKRKKNIGDYVDREVRAEDINIIE